MEGRLTTNYQMFLYVMGKTSFQPFKCGWRICICSFFLPNKLVLVLTWYIMYQNTEHNCFSSKIWIITLNILYKSLCPIIFFNLQLHIKLQQWSKWIKLHFYSIAVRKESARSSTVEFVHSDWPNGCIYMRHLLRSCLIRSAVNTLAPTCPALLGQRKLINSAAR